MKIKVLIFLLFFSSFSILLSSVIPDKPIPERLYNDFTGGFLSNDEALKIEDKLRWYNDSTSTQIVMVVVDDLGGYDKGSYAIELGEKWGVGQKGKDNGIVILIKPTGNKGERGVFIATGYGVESIITDAVSKRIIEEDMLPYFREGKYYEGLNRAIDRIMGLLSGSFSAEVYLKGRNKQSGWVVLLIMFFIFIIGIII